MLSGGISASDVPVDANCLVVRGDEARVRATFCPNRFAVSKLDDDGGLLVEEKVVPPLCTDEADSAGGGLATV